MSFAILTRSLTKTFRHTAALDRVGIEVPEGAIYALVGPNGAGKTTLIKVLMNIFGPTSGTAEVKGLDSRRIRGKAFQRIGYVSENQQMPDWMTVGAMLRYYRNFYQDWDLDLQAQLVRQFDLPLDHRLKHLSHGIRVKAALASSLAYRPSLIILDEPFSGLDPLVRDELIEGLLDRAEDTTIFLSSHDLAEIESFSSHVGFLENGRLLFQEEMASLTARFREITVTVDERGPIPSGIPVAWLQVEAVDSVVRFVDSHYEPDKTRRDISAAFPHVREIAADPMTLRAIFLAIAKSKRVRTPGAQSTTSEEEVSA